MCQHLVNFENLINFPHFWVITVEKMTYWALTDWLFIRVFPMAKPRKSIPEEWQSTVATIQFHNIGMDLNSWPKAPIPPMAPSESMVATESLLYGLIAAEEDQKFGSKEKLDRLSQFQQFTGASPCPSRELVPSIGKRRAALADAMSKLPVSKPEKKSEDTKKKRAREAPPSSLVKATFPARDDIPSVDEQSVASAYLESFLNSCNSSGSSTECPSSIGSMDTSKTTSPSVMGGTSNNLKGHNTNGANALLSDQTVVNNESKKSKKQKVFDQVERWNIMLTQANQGGGV